MAVPKVLGTASGIAGTHAARGDQEASNAGARGIPVTPGCTCTPRRRAWQPDGTCAACGNRVREVQIMDVVQAVLVSDPRCVLWRNEIGFNTHFPDGTKRKHPIKYGICNPGGADLIGSFGARLLAVETKTVRGAQTAEQIAFELVLAAHGNIYAICRSETEAGVLLQWLAAGAVAPLPEELRGEGQQQTRPAGP